MLSLFWASQHHQTCYTWRILHLLGSYDTGLQHRPQQTHIPERHWITAEKQVSPGIHSRVTDSRQFQLPEGGVAKVTHKPRLNTSSGSVASRGKWAVSSRPIPQCNSGRRSWLGSLPVWLLASWDILYSLINSFSAHTIFQLAATENSDRDGEWMDWLFISSLTQGPCPTPLKKEAGSQNGRNYFNKQVCETQSLNRSALFSRWQNSTLSRKLSLCPLFLGT